MKVLFFCLFTLLLFLSAKKKHLVSQSQDDKETCYDHNCLVCEGLYNCTKCAEPLITSLSGFCVTGSCSNGQYFDSERNYCRKCSFGCSRCVSRETCLACNETMGQVMNAENKCHCKDSSFMNYESRMCQACPVGCLECYLENDCSKCKEGLVFKENEGCIPCKAESFFNANSSKCSPCVPGCLQCTSRTECIQCDEANNFIPIFETLCDCKSGFFLDFSHHHLVCTKCLENCKICAELTSCDVCDEGFILNDQKHCEAKQCLRRKQLEEKIKHEI